MMNLLNREKQVFSINELFDYFHVDIKSQNIDELSNQLIFQDRKNDKKKHDSKQYISQFV
jgi:hypothetical protein